MIKAASTKPSNDGWQANEAYIRRICAYKLSSHPDEIDDAVQEIALAYYEAIRKGTDIKDAKKWLTVVASNIINETYKRIMAEEKRVISIEEDAAKRLIAREEPEELTEETLLRCKEDFTATLSEDELLLFHLRFEKRMRIKAIARKMGISEGNVRQRIFRLKRRAKKYVAEWNEKNV